MRLVCIILLVLYSLLALGQTAEQYHDKAMKQIDKGNYQAALKNAEMALQKDTTQARYYQLMVLALLGNQRLGSAMGMCDHAIDVYPDSLELYFMKAKILDRSAEFRNAIKVYDEALQYAVSDTQLYRIYNRRAETKRHMRDFESSYADLMLAYQIDSTGHSVLVNLGNVLDDMGRVEESLVYYLKDIELRPNKYESYMNVGFTLQRQGYHNRAIEFFNKSLELNDKAAYIYNNRGYSKLMLGDVKGAMKDVERSIEMSPANAYAYRNRGLIYLRMNELENACIDFQIATELKFKIRYGDEVEDLMKQYCGR